jgi:hypothetical protein
MPDNRCRPGGPVDPLVAMHHLPIPLVRLPPKVEKSFAYLDLDMQAVFHGPQMDYSVNVLRHTRSTRSETLIRS